MEYYPRPIDEIRGQEFPQLNGRTYLDHAGSQLSPNSLLDAFTTELKSTIYGNPHSESTPSKSAGERIDEIRLRTLAFFGADPDEYDLIFVANATAAVKLVCDGIRDFRRCDSRGQRRQLLGKFSRKAPAFNIFFHKDAHTSLVGIREHATRQRCFTSDAEVEAWITSLSSPSSSPADSKTPTLFAYPGQSNMTGRRLPASWCSTIRESPNTSHIYTLLDAAALATTKRLQVSDWKPTFVALSFYKIFGFPDLGALLVHKAHGGPILDARRYFGGGTVDMVIALDGAWHTKRVAKPLHERHEDGTLPFHNIVALGHALDSITRVYGSINKISQHTSGLVGKLYGDLVGLRHGNGEAVVKVYADDDPGERFKDPERQGATLSFTVLAADGSPMSYKNVEKAADLQHIYLRAGSLCNPGGMASYLGWSARELRRAHRAGHSCSSPIEVFEGRSSGVVRASFGACSSAEDGERLVRFVKETYTDVVTSDFLVQPMVGKRERRKVWMRVRAVPVPIVGGRARGRGREEDVFFVTSGEERIVEPSPERSDNCGCPLEEMVLGEKNEVKDKGLFSRSRKWAKSIVDLRRVAKSNDSMREMTVVEI